MITVLYRTVPYCTRRCAIAPCTQAGKYLHRAGLRRRYLPPLPTHLSCTTTTSLSNYTKSALISSYRILPSLRPLTITSHTSPTSPTYQLCTSPISPFSPILTLLAPPASFCPGPREALLHSACAEGPLVPRHQPPIPIVSRSPPPASRSLVHVPSSPGPLSSGTTTPRPPTPFLPNRGRERRLKR